MNKGFKINTELYSEEILKQAIDDFSEVGDIKLNKNTLEFSGESEDEIEEIFNELMNYCISLINEQ